jgi:hypothetical protein
MLLERHVRFEERELFPAAERLLSEVELAAIGNAASSSKARGRASIRTEEEGEA